MYSFTQQQYLTPTIMSLRACIFLIFMELPTSIYRDLTSKIAGKTDPALAHFHMYFLPNLISLAVQSNFWCPNLQSLMKTDLSNWPIKNKQKIDFVDILESIFFFIKKIYDCCGILKYFSLSKIIRKLNSWIFQHQYFFFVKNI